MLVNWSFPRCRWWMLAEIAHSFYAAEVGRDANGRARALKRAISNPVVFVDEWRGFVEWHCDIKPPEKRV